MHFSGDELCIRNISPHPLQIHEKDWLGGNAHKA